MDWTACVIHITHAKHTCVLNQFFPLIRFSSVDFNTVISNKCRIFIEIYWIRRNTKKWDFWSCMNRIKRLSSMKRFAIDWNWTISNINLAATIEKTSWKSTKTCKIHSKKTRTVNDFGSKLIYSVWWVNQEKSKCWWHLLRIKQLYKVFIFSPLIYNLISDLYANKTAKPES